MADTTSATMTVTNSMYNLQIDVAANGEFSKTLKTVGTYVDKDIKVTVSTPDAEFKVTDAGTITACVSTTDTVYTSDTTTSYGITIAADASVTDVTVGINTPGFAAASDTVTVSGSSATQSTKTIYVKAGSLEKKSSDVAVTANGGAEITESASQPTSGFYITATSNASVGVATAGWVNATNNPSVTTSDTKYYTIASATLANTAGADASYATITTPVLVSGSGLYINEGYIENTYIALADLVPDEATIAKAADGTNDMMYGISAYDKNGALVSGSMALAKLSTITANDASTDITSVSVAANDDSSAFKVTATGTISGTASVTVTQTGYATATLNSSGTISGTATVNASLAKIALGVTVSDEDKDVEVKPVIKQETSTASTGTITATAPTTGKYVAISADAISASVTVSANVATAGYGTADVYSQTGATIKAGSAASGTYYVPITTASHSAAQDGTTVVTAPVTTVTTNVSGGDVTPVTYAAAQKVEGTEYVKIAASSATTNGSTSGIVKCSSTEGYIDATDNSVTISAVVTVADASATDMYIKVYDGSII